MGHDQTLGFAGFSRDIDPPQLSIADALAVTAVPDYRAEISTNLAAAVSALVAGLHDAGWSTACSQRLAELYSSRSGEPLQRDIFLQLTTAPQSPVLEDLVQTLLTDRSEESYSRQFDDADRQQIRELFATPADARAELLLRQLLNPSGDGNPPFPPLSDQPVDRIRIYNAFATQEVGSRRPTATGSDDPDQLRNHLIDLAVSDPQEFFAVLAAQLSESSHFGRVFGSLMARDIAFRDIMTAGVLRVLDSSNSNRVAQNALSYLRQVGADTVIPLLDRDQKAELVPRLLGQSPGDEIQIARDDFLSRVDHGEVMTLQTLAMEGPVAMPVLWSLRFEKPSCNGGES